MQSAVWGWYESLSELADHWDIDEALVMRERERERERASGMSLSVSDDQQRGEAIKVD